MASLQTELTERFERYCDTKDASLPEDVMHELQSMLRLYSISPEELLTTTFCAAAEPVTSNAQPLP